MNSFLRMITLALIVSVSGCATLADKWHTTTIEDTARGEQPVDYVKSIKAHLENKLKDPFSAQYKDFSLPNQGSYSKNEVIQSPTLVNVNGYNRVTNIHGWRVTVEVNAKNSYGAYAGWKTYTFLFRGEEIIYVLG